MATVKIIFHGKFKKLYPEEVTLEGNSVAELINGLCKQDKRLHAKLGKDRYSLTIQGFSDEESLYAELPEDFKELHIFPALCGGKNGGIFQILLGVVLVVVGIAVIIIGAGNPVALAIGQALIGAGIGLAIGGVIAMLSPAPELDFGGFNDPESSKYLLSNQNTVKSGTRIPLLYGRSLAYGHYLSFNIDSKDLSSASVTNPASTFSLIGAPA